ncbi:hypothetical protein EHQ82_01785 [Leptospira selangorensis]|uniref:Lipoprotein n=1 Tax=Leptospira selangorensis TaxID=2484982 RepID=A0ABY2NI21_9LEPT|nr:hypothetical protein [Leptospira selangorensis]TGM27905.1 hypothetical protein EHQ82_01785 [Leptospira selangorensis]
MNKIQRCLGILIFITIYTNCRIQNNFSIDDCLIPNSSNKSSDIIRIVSINENFYKYFSHFYSNGKFVQAEDYQTKEIKNIDENYSKVSCPIVDTTFSPDKYLNQKRN